MNKNLIIRIVGFIIASWGIEYAIFRNVTEVISLNILLAYLIGFSAIVCTVLWKIGWLKEALSDFGDIDK